MTGHVPAKAKHRKAARPGLRLFLVVGAFYASVLGTWVGYRRWVSAVRLDTAKPEYLHDEFIELRLRTRDPSLRSRWRRSPPRASVRAQDGSVVETIGGLREVELSWDARARAFAGRWPCPWNAPPGAYTPGLEGEPRLERRLSIAPFRIARRAPAALPPRFVALTFESVKSFATMKVRAPDGTVKDWRGLLDWVQFVEADAFWVLAGQTPGERPGEAWLATNLKHIPMVAAECRRRGIKFGVWAMCYLTMSRENRVPGYEYAMDVQDGQSVLTRAISLRDPRRPQDIAEFLKRFRDIPGVDFLGLDYIRNALGGYELAEDFFAEMPGVRPPPEWPRLTHEERMVWFARKKIMRRDKAFVDAWQWWRAHRVGAIVRRIKAELGDSKPLWAFTLTWDKGWHHGQDAVMMNDAGVDVDALMLYEADAEQFDQMIKDWHRYVRGGDVQLIVGDVVDWPLHQRDPRGPEAYRARTVKAVDEIYKDRRAAGLFIHDLDRALWGRLGPWSTKDWLEAARAAVRHLRSP